MPDPVADPPAPAPGTPTPTPAASGASGGQPPPAQRDDGVIDPDDSDDDADLTRDQRQNRLNKRLRRAAVTARERAVTAETELTTLRAKVQQLEAQNGSVAKLRQSLLSSAVRAEAAPLVLADALDDTIRLLDLSDLKVGDDGTVDAAKVKEKIEALVKAKPYLAAAASGAARPLPGGHGAPAPGSGHEGFNQLVRQAAGR
jgi:hypothetical protein